MAENRVAANLPDILDAIQEKLANDGVLDSTRIFPTLADDDAFEKTPADDQFITLTPGRHAAITDEVTGGGNLVLSFNGNLTIGLWTRLEIDQDNRDEFFLKDKTYGILAKWKALLISLSLFDPTDETGANMLLEEPMRCLGFETRPRRQKDWGKLVSYWETKWQQAIT